MNSNIKIEGLSSLAEILQNNIFRVPDYQRGYSWKREQVEALWKDIQNINDNIHYTGMITVHQPSSKESKRWEEDLNCQVTNDNTLKFKDKEYELLYIVDGQQRITSIFLLFAALMHSDKFNAKNSKLNPEILVFIDKEKSKLRFGYDLANPTQQFLTNKIVNVASQPPTKETAYTKNISNAFDFFTEKIETLDEDNKSLKKLYRKILFGLRFNFWKIPNTYLDVFTIFETMNYRGLKLSTLELLKNRLIYLVTLLDDTNTEQEEEIRSKINENWQIIYSALAQGAKNLKDDDFLKCHWLMYFNHQEQKSNDLNNFQKSLLDEKFAKDNINSIVTKDYILDYIKSLSSAAQKYFEINYPTSTECVELDKGVRVWIEKINRLGNRYFEPLMLGGAFTLGVDDYIKLVKAIERFIFLIFEVSGRKSSTYKKESILLANQLYSKNANVIKIIEKLTPTDGKKSHRALDNLSLIKDRFKENLDSYFSQGEGFLSWNNNGKAVKYLLAEYEEENGFQVDWQNTIIDNVYPEKLRIPLRDEARREIALSFNDEIKRNFTEISTSFGETGQTYLCYSLGNLVLLNAKLGNEIKAKYCSFSKQHVYEQVPSKASPKHKQDLYRFEEGIDLLNKNKYATYSSNQIAQRLNWTSIDILNRGVELISFLERRWQIFFDKSSHPELEFEQTNFWDTKHSLEQSNSPYQNKIQLLHLSQHYKKIIGASSKPSGDLEGLLDALNRIDEFIDEEE